MASEQFSEIIRLLIKYPMTTEMIYRSSKNFIKEYASMGTLRNHLCDMHSRGFLGRQEIPSTGDGRKPYLYFPSRKIRRLPEFGELELPKSAFRGFTGSFWHSEGTSEFMSHLERSAGEAEIPVELIASVRDRYFKVPLQIRVGSGTRKTSLVPDYTTVISIKGKPSLLFLEILHNTAVINPMSPQSVARSFRFQMTKYRVFQKSLQTNPDIQDWQTQFNCRFVGFRVLVVTKKGETHKNSLLNLAKTDGYMTQFYFADMNSIRSANIFTDPVWSLPNGQKRGLS